MTNPRVLPLATIAMLLGLAACGGDGSGFTDDDGSAGDVDDDGGGDADSGGGDADAGADADLDVPPTDRCNLCHGDPDSPAPPASLDGQTATTVRGVGAHRSHLQVSTWHRNVQCADCHIVPANVSDPGHIDTDLPAEVTWGALPLTRGAAPTWDGATCSGVYCHGAVLQPGGTNTHPTWTTVDGTQAACGTCHGLPPGGTHPSSSSQCETCHGEVIAAGHVFVRPELHIDGVVQVSSPHPAGWSDGDVHGAAAEANLDSCKVCHGADLRGGTAGVSCFSCHPTIPTGK